MEAAPVATFKVHEYLRPKVRWFNLQAMNWLWFEKEARAYMYFRFAAYVKSI